jgi:lysylphosphatidylglycerol synthetase-like protein (DUF2156 family)
LNTHLQEATTNNSSGIDKEKVRSWVQQYGGSASICYLDCNCSFFVKEGIEGAVGYRVVARCAVVMGDPLCKEEDKLALSLFFKDEMKKRSLPVIYITASESFTKMSQGKTCASCIEVVDELICNPQKDPKVGTKGKRLRGKVNQARRLGVTAHEYTTLSPSLEKEMEDVALQWLSKRSGPQIFLTTVELFSIREGKRWVYAKQQGKIVGVALLHEMKAYGGWLLQFLLTTPEAPCGTSELLIDSSLHLLCKEGSAALSFGSAQKKQIGLILGLSKTSMLLTKLIYGAAQKIFPLNERRRFWMKFSPNRVPAFLLFEKNRLSIREIRAILKSVNAKI